MGCRVRFLIILSCMPVIMVPFGLEGSERSGMHFLRIGIGGRAGAMGEAYSSVARGAEALYWNPAGTAFTDGREVIL